MFGLGLNTISSGGGAIDITINGSGFLTNQTIDTDISVVNSAATPVGSENGGVWEIADVSWTDSDGSAETTPYGNAIVCTTYPIAYIRDGFINQETASNLNGDVKWYITNTSLFDYSVVGIRPLLDIDNAALLLNNNSFGNLNRVTNDKGATNYTDVGGGLTSDGATANYAIDHYTGLGITLNSLHAGTQHWVDSVVTVQAHTITAYNSSVYSNFRMLTSRDVNNFSTIDGLSNVFSSIENWADTSHLIMNSSNATTIYIWRDNQSSLSSTRFGVQNATTINAAIDLIAVRNHF